MPDALSPEKPGAVRDHPKFHILLRRRGRLSRTLSTIALGTFALLVAIMAFAPGLAARPIGAGHAMTVGLALGLAVVVGLVVTAAIYVRRSNQEFEALIREITADIQP